MVRCIDCLHFDVCKTRCEELCKWTKIEDLFHNCTKFKDRTNCVEVVRCKDCKHFRKHKDGDYCYAKIRPTKEDDFCSYGERRNDV